MLDPLLTPLVVKARGQPLYQVDRPIGRPQKQRASIRSHQPAVESGFHRPPFDRSKIKAVCATFCRHRGSPPIIEMSLQHNNFR
jgi:hypothetical protein